MRFVGCIGPEDTRGTQYLQSPVGSGRESVMGKKTDRFL
ncbi:hypothetical protein D779_2778 [Imhoffiella purpurea]|uniref:Uncharacterized protein n=1 Tax=Imhoffiella purpurea TaxID=1249627 RepID=W9V474_9GAMM|nr:hypothetical protein D779_2778 [Imhoffiella purpurea]